MNEQTGEDLEGIETEISSASWGDYPLDSVFVRREERTVNEVISRIKRGRYQLDPDFQRTFVWDALKQSKLIESCLMRIPLPVFYVAEAKDGRIIVVDGLQRLTTLQRFLDGKFALELGKLDNETPHPLNGNRFLNLTVTLQERILDTSLLLYILDSKAPERARLDIFERVNSGVPLSRQQMRNSLYNGKATKWLRSAAESSEFLEVTGASLDQKTMRDREVINRFCAFRLFGYEKYKRADMDRFLGRALEHMNASSDQELDNLMDEFKHSMKMNYRIFGDHSFRKSLLDNDPYQRRSPINVSLFDVYSVLLADLPSNLEKSQLNNIGKILRKLVIDDEFNFAITYSTNSTKQVEDRFEIAYSALEGII
ncbi:MULTISPECIES: DUF262 domain-containing protein [Gluconobacter]|uniref:GmrSD restriction endonucleases N-terminal domain-containing protein n=2 Tax=Gluconobacter TaxID=441 RepID=A0A829XDS6_GLUOY|nr:MULTISPECIES: DUF262 domain-containing protein [Gluconobacter]QEH97974.1 DUF262 domain-containing protein [Gluconobacter thailandicus]GEM18466.1 hypothetical protein NBRC3293_2963 [Gluconobacter oxydans NBRC 3293]GEM18592.1 hypothetical protein NBRC3293_3089 [Gluconobacter oxydans NBRC 3293]